MPGELIAATNRLDTLDPALLRPGRFSRHIHVSSPSEDGRLAILGVHSKGKPLAEDVDLPHLAKVTAGASGAELAEMLSEGAIMAAREERLVITHEDLFEGFLRVVAGPRKASAMLAAGERETVADHEAGHVLCAELCPTVDKTLHATINPRGRAAGFAVIGRSDRALLAAGDVDHLEIAAAMEGSTVVARRPNLQPLPDPTPVAEPVEAEPAPHPRRRLWVPGPTGAGSAIAAFRAARDLARS